MGSRDEREAQLQLPGFEKLSNDKIELIAFFIDEIEDNMRSDDFQRDFFEDLSDYYTKRNTLTDKQIASLKKIYERVTND